MGTEPMSPSPHGPGRALPPPPPPPPPPPEPPPDPSFAGRIVASLSRGPGGDERYVSGLSTISSTIAPSSRCCTRSVWVPVAAKYTLTPGAPQPLSAQPQP